MHCQSKWCTWISTLSQLAVAAVVVYAGLVVNTHMESWTKSFQRGSEDLHSIRENMNTMAYSLESINKDMDSMNTQVSQGLEYTHAMQQDIHNLYFEINNMNQQIYYMNGSVGNMSQKFSPSGMMRGFMPF